jgi:hypothetical protein
MTEEPVYGAPEFDWGILERPTALAMVRGQLEFSWLELRTRLRTVVDDAELHGEPAPGALRVVRRGEERTPRTLGVGEWVAEWPADVDAPNPRTIAWLVAHLTETVLERWEWTFGGHRLRREDLDVAGEAGPAVAQLERWVDAWRSGIAGLAEDDVFTVGLSQATPIDARAPFGHLVLHINREIIHHGAEIMALTDHYRAARAASAH